MNQKPPLLTQPVAEQVQNMADRAEATGTDVLKMARRAFLAYVGAFVVVQEETEKVFNDLVQKGEKSNLPPVKQINSLAHQTNKNVQQVEARTEDVIDDVVAEIEARMGVATDTDLKRLNREIDGLNKKVDEYITEIEAERRAEARRAAAERRAEEKRAEERRQAARKAAQTRAERRAEEQEAEAEAEVSPVEMPIAGYDEMNVDQVVARLDKLSIEELRAVRAHEEDNKGRVGVMRAIDERMTRLLPLEGYDEMTADEVEREINDLSADELQAIQRYEVEHKNRKSLLENIDRRLNWLLPIADYDNSNVDDTVAQLEGMNVETLRRVRQYEIEHKNRAGVLEAIDRRLVVDQENQ